MGQAAHGNRRAGGRLRNAALGTGSVRGQGIDNGLASVRAEIARIDEKLSGQMARLDEKIVRLDEKLTFTNKRLDEALEIRERLAALEAKVGR